MCTFQSVCKGQVSEVTPNTTKNNFYLGDQTNVRHAGNQLYCTVPVSLREP